MFCIHFCTLGTNCFSLDVFEARIQDFSSGGVQVNLTKKSSDVFFFFFFFLCFFFSSPQLLLLESNGYFRRKLSFFNVPEGVQHFPGGSNYCLFPIETHITCDFPGVVRTPCPPLWIRTCYPYIIIHILASPVLNSFMSSADFFKINFFEKFFQEYHKSVKQLGSRSGPTISTCWSAFNCANLAFMDFFWFGLIVYISVNNFLVML